MSGWHFAGSCADGQPFALEGLDVWSCAWIPRLGEVAEVRDPHYQQRFTFPVYELQRGHGERVVFAAGEFSNCIWGFYRPAPAGAG